MRLILMPHKCKCLPSDDNGFRREETIYPVLHCVLSEDKNLRKRTYLSRYLMTIDVSMEYLLMQANGNLEELLEANQGVARGGEISSSVLFLVICVTQGFIVAHLFRLLKCMSNESTVQG